MFRSHVIKDSQQVYKFKGYNLARFQRSFFLYIFELKLFCFVVALCDLVHDVEAIHGLS